MTIQKIQELLFHDIGDINKIKSYKFDNIGMKMLVVRVKKALEEAEKRGQKKSALQIVKDLGDFEYEHETKIKCLNYLAIKWGIMKGFGIEPAELAEKK